MKSFLVTRRRPRPLRRNARITQLDDASAPIDCHVVTGDELPALPLWEAAPPSSRRAGCGVRPGDRQEADRRGAGRFDDPSTRREQRKRSGVVGAARNELRAIFPRRLHACRGQNCAWCRDRSSWRDRCAAAHSSAPPSDNRREVPSAFCTLPASCRSASSDAA